NNSKKFFLLSDILRRNTPHNRDKGSGCVDPDDCGKTYPDPYIKNTSRMEIVILIGVQASGKTTFYRDRFVNTHIRISLDMLKTRTRESILMKACIAAQQSFVVDNTNVTREQRSQYLELGKQHRIPVVGYFFQSEVKDILQRNKQRTGKAKVPAPGIFATLKKLQPPVMEEGFTQLFVVKIEEPNTFTMKEYF